MERKFLADAMLGSLARWLRVMGYDTHYQSFYTRERLGDLLSGGRMLLSRHRKTARHYPFSLLILPDRVGEQIRQMNAAGWLHPDRSRWFTRCLRCNVTLEKADPREAREFIPDHVFTHHSEGIRTCPSCNRYYWPGSHREKMLTQLEEWVG
ncbi:MAG: Mut7-C RNAse domain-containing protein [Thermodesulfobacteriota bacterium]